MAPKAKKEVPVFLEAKAKAKALKIVHNHKKEKLLVSPSSQQPKPLHVQISLEGEACWTAVSSGPHDHGVSHEGDRK
jgi:hypothetical protein